MMENSQFYLWLPSNSSMDVFPSNTLTEYQVRLPQSIVLSGDCEVALTEIQYPRSWNNVHGGFWNRFYIQSGTSAANPITVVGVPPGHYKTTQSVLDAVNKEVQKNEQYKTDVSFTYDELSRKVTIHLQNNNHIVFNEIGLMLGFPSGELIEKTSTAKNEFDLDFGFHNLFVYCDIVQPQTVGDAQVPLLRVVPVEGNDGDRITRSFMSPQYLPVSKKEFDAMEVNIKRDTGKKVPFESGRVLLTLHFRRASPFFH